MESRVSHLKDVCHQLKLDQVGNDSLHKPDPWEYLINKEHHLVWCNVFKSGSSRYLNKLQSALKIASFEVN
jgi:chondroitin 4-sulfotransferase 11